MSPPAPSRAERAPRRGACRGGVGGTVARARAGRPRRAEAPPAGPAAARVGAPARLDARPVRPVTTLRHTFAVDAAELRERVERDIRDRDLIPPGGEVVCLVSGGPDSTCLWHVLRELGYGVSALHVDHGLRGAESEEDARFCREVLGAEVVGGRAGQSPAEDELRQIRYSFAADRLRA